MDRLEITGLTIATKIGVHTWEKRIVQRLVLNISIPTNFNDCNDDINKTIDYAKLTELVTTFVESNSFNLIETVADNVAQLIKKEFSLNEVTVSVSKPHAIKNATDVRVCVNR
ncbi:dihydroneopterin aldolase [Legionella gresilensis]|uniref:dihydroneopterin aldolase n=1 Tax=Legionella gresilensis TaxID=91823 RepID=UPI00104192C5|nr:dihydroneopterin aldolase [Legionella gresilensis]